jgi:hypothetical protein
MASDSVAIAYYTEAQMLPCDCHATTRHDIFVNCYLPELQPSHINHRIIVKRNLPIYLV